jgi:hypothetical protein
VHDWKRHGLEQVDPLTRENGEPLGVGQIAGVPKEIMDPVEVARDFLRQAALEAEPRQGLNSRFHPVLHLDEILAAGPVARLELQVTGNHPMIADSHPGKALELLLD